MTYFDIIADAETKPYSLGEHDCFVVACKVVGAASGVDYWTDFPKYRTRKQSLARIASIAPTFRDAVTTFFGLVECMPTMARRGDIVLYDDGDLEHLGVCLGEHVAVLGENGLLRISIASPRLVTAWRVQWSHS